MTQRLCNVGNNMENCPCTYEPCSKKGVCCECIRYHLKRNELPACCFPLDVEKTYNRSFERFIESYSKT
ncbi:MAG TPA: cytosolic protein [Thermoplasmata archaeon]|nr:cytosolic protein [Thermoplasmata archaeon]